MIMMFAFIPTAKADSFTCLVEAIYHEARSQSLIGMLAVTNVILTRTYSKKFPDTICGVVHQGRYWKNSPVRDKCQFSYWCDGKPEKYNDIKSLTTSINVAELALKGVVVSKIREATHYHASYVKPFWASEKNFKFLAQIEDHLFYVDKKNK